MSRFVIFSNPRVVERGANLAGGAEPGADPTSEMFK